MLSEAELKASYGCVTLSPKLPNHPSDLPLLLLFVESVIVGEESYAPRLSCTEVYVVSETVGADRAVYRYRITATVGMRMPRRGLARGAAVLWSCLWWA